MTAFAGAPTLDEVVDVCLAAAAERDVDVCIAIVDAVGDPQRLARTPSAAPLSGLAALSVAYSTVLATRHAGPVDVRTAIPRTARALGLFPIVEARGGAPLRSGHTVVGAIGVVCVDEVVAEEIADAGARIHLLRSLDA